jgi:hypothetical protein
VRLPRKRRPAASGFLARSAVPLPEDRQGLAVSTLGKVIRRGWDWIGLSSSSPGAVFGLIEAPGLAAALTLNKGDFVRAGRRGITYLGYRKAIQEAVQAQLAAWGEARDREDAARRRAARPLERDLESVLVDLADEFPALSALVERRAGGQKRLPTVAPADPSTGASSSSGAPAGGAAPAVPETDGRGDVRDGEAPVGDGNVAPPSGADTAFVSPDDTSVASGDRGEPHDTDASAHPARAPAPPGQSMLQPSGPTGPRRPTRYGLAVDFEEQPESHALGRLVESTVLVNTAHPAYLRAVASRSDGYHAALTVAMALADVAVEPLERQGFVSVFLARWGEAIGRDRRRRQPQARSRRRS